MGKRADCATREMNREPAGGAKRERVFETAVDVVIGKETADKIRENRKEMDTVYPDPKSSPPPKERDPNGPKN